MRCATTRAGHPSARSCLTRPGRQWPTPPRHEWSMKALRIPSRQSGGRRWLGRGGTEYRRLHGERVTWYMVFSTTHLTSVTAASCRTDNSTCPTERSGGQGPHRAPSISISALTYLVEESACRAV